ncbi:hypothetical protein ACO0QE_001718 [Hanseniaspora vineae]
MRYFASMFFRRHKLLKHICLSLFILLTTITILHKLEAHKNEQLQSYMNSLPSLMDNVLGTSTTGNSGTSGTSSSSYINTAYQSTNLNNIAPSKINTAKTIDIITHLKNLYRNTKFNKHNVETNIQSSAFEYPDITQRDLYELQMEKQNQETESVPQFLPSKDQKTYEFDIKRTLASYYQLIDSFPAIGELPFNWYDWRKNVGDNLNKYIETRDYLEKLSCSKLYNDQKEENKQLDHDKIRQYCKDIRSKEEMVMNIHPDLESDGIDVDYLYDHVSEKAMHILTSSYLYNGKMQPLSLTFLDSRNGDIKQYKTKFSTPFFQTRESDIVRNKLEKSGQAAQKKSTKKKVNNKFDTSSITNILDMAWNKMEYQDNEIKVGSTFDRFDTKFDPYRQESTENNKNVLPAHQEHFNAAKKFVDHPSTHKNTSEFRYFLEARDFDAHIYPQFFNYPLDHNVLTKGQSLHDLARVWFKFIEGTKQVSSWLAHGSLLAYVYNAEVFPWDDDHDVQLPINDLILLAEKFNQTLIVSENGSPMFFDVSPYILKGRHYSDEWYNHIDARLVDITSGYYIDITGVGYSNENNNINKNDHLRFVDEQKALDDKTMDNVLQFHKDHGIVNCKNKHFSLIDELVPTKKVLFGGVPAQVPHQSLPSLKSEYSLSKLLYAKTHDFRYHNYVPELRAWIPNSWTKQKFSTSYFERSQMGQTDVETLHENLLKTIKQNQEDKDYIEFFQDETLIYVLNLQHTTLNRLETMNIEMDYTKNLLEKETLIHDINHWPLVERSHRSRLIQQFHDNLFEKTFAALNITSFDEYNSLLLNISTVTGANDAVTMPVQSKGFQSKEQLMNFLKNSVIKDEIDHYIEIEKKFHITEDYDFVKSAETINYYKDETLPADLNTVLNKEVPKIYKLRNNKDDEERSEKPKPFVRDYNV